MSTRQSNGTQYENHQRASELPDLPAHAYRVAAEQHGKQDHLTGQEHSRQAGEHSRDDHWRAQAPTVGHGMAAFGHDDIAALAHALWLARGCPEGSPEQDWYQAAEQLRSLACECEGVSAHATRTGTEPRS